MFLHFEALCRHTREFTTNYMITMLKRCKPLMFVKRPNTVLPCDLEDVDFLQPPLQTVCIEHYDHSPLARIAQYHVLCLMGHETYPTMWQYAVLIYDHERKKRYVVRSCDEQWRTLRPYMIVLWRYFVRRMNREFTVNTGVRHRITTPKDMQSNHDVLHSVTIMTPYTKEDERHDGLKDFIHRVPTWLRGVWLPCLDYGTNRDGDYMANWDWRVADDDRVFNRHQKMGKKAVHYVPRQTKESSEDVLQNSDVLKLDHFESSEAV